MKYKILTNSYGVGLIEYILRQGLLNNGFDSKEELEECFPDSKLSITYTNIEVTKKIYAIKNTKTNKLVYNKVICNPPHKFYEKLGTVTKALDNYKKYYDSKVKEAHYKERPFLKDNLPEDLKVVTYYLVEEGDNNNEQENK